jgi:hypothetical protein
MAFLEVTTRPCFPLNDLLPDFNKGNTTGVSGEAVTELLNQGFLLVKLKLSLRKCYSRHPDLVDRYGISVSNDQDMFHLS